MTAAEIDSILKQTLADFRISASEKRSLQDWLQTSGADVNDLALVRSRAFALARSEAIDPNSVKLLDWLEELLKAIQPRESKGNSLVSKAFFSPGNQCVTEVIRQFNAAKSSCDICVFTITDDRITNAILKAHARGITVKIISDDDKSEDLGSDIQQLKRGGVPVKLDRTPFHMHHKFALFDASQLLTGSFNWTRSATENNEENLIVTADPILVHAFRERFATLWAKLENA
jgi:phosphatidylserine/phosphatidylglycerophosphate/cardiolipin synthase-like enzyme